MNQSGLLRFGLSHPVILAFLLVHRFNLPHIHTTCQNLVLLSNNLVSKPFLARKSWAPMGNEHGIESADQKGIGQLLTAHIRGDRFNDGHLLHVMDSGQMDRILKRLGEFHQGTPDKEVDHNP